MLGNKIKDNRKRWQYLFVKYIIKSPILYYGYLIFFLFFIIFVANYIKLDVRETLPGVLMDNQIILDKRIKSPIDDEIFIYKDKSQSVWKEKVLNVNTKNGQTYLTMQNKANKLSGNVTVEFVTEKRTLIHILFIKVGGGS